MYQVNPKRKRFARWCIDLAIHDALAIARKQSVISSFQQLLDVVHSRTTILRPSPPCGRPYWLDTFRLVRGLLMLSKQRHWIRPPETWQPDEALHQLSGQQGAIRQFESLVMHLLATHPVPRFMMGVWFEEPSPQAGEHQKLFRHLARGNSIRGAKLPIAFTRPMARWFERAPEHFTVEQALRWSQVRAWGGEAPLAAAIARTRLGSTFADEERWSRVLQYWINRPPRDMELIDAIVEYLHSHPRCWDRALFQVARGQGCSPIEREVRHWLKQQPGQARTKASAWPGAGISGLHAILGSGDAWSFRFWSIRELTTSTELAEEGQAMHHCVASYAQRCAQRHTSIWSLRRLGLMGVERVLTIEVDLPRRTVVTALGPFNALPDRDSMQIVSHWAREQNLQMVAWLERFASNE